MHYVIQKEGDEHFTCRFVIQGVDYYASLIKVWTYTECVVVNDANMSVLYQKHQVPLTEEALLACIEEFVSTLPKS